jgi:hypothetical protein
MELQRQEHDQQAMIEARIRRVSNAAPIDRSGQQPPSGRPARPERRTAALQLLDKRTDLVG